MYLYAHFLLWYEEIVPNVCPKPSATFRILRILTYRSGLKSYRNSVS
jgi:hypothetical protein